METVDGYVLLLRRGEDVGEAPGLLVFPGGHPEPGNVTLVDSDGTGDGDAHMADAEVKTQGARNLGAEIASHGAEVALQSGTDWDAAVTEELYDSMLREITEETGLPRCQLGKPRFIGAARRKENVRPGLFFHVDADVTAEEARAAFKNREDKFEALSLDLVAVEDLPAMCGEGARVMPGCHAGCVKLFEMCLWERAMRGDDAWLI